MNNSHMAWRTFRGRELKPSMFGKTTIKENILRAGLERINELYISEKLTR